jgi:hypothetical protein
MEELNLYGLDLLGDPITPPSRGAVSDKFIVPPFSVLNARNGFWQKRKRMWRSLGIDAELGRSGKLSGFSSPVDALSKIDGVKRNTAGTSIFDPVLCELMYSWFCPAGGQVLDPFAGGAVRGVVASMLGLSYWGCDLRPEQTEANQKQGADIVPDNKPTWITGDALDAVPSAPQADFVFSCPPYGDLERYSDDPADLSTMDYHAFVAAYKRIIMRACERLKANRFACFVVGDFRNPRTGLYRGFVADTERAFIEQGLGLYNDMVLITAVGAGGMCLDRQFSAGRKAVKTHQNVLVFVKGDPRRAADACKQ